MVLAEVGEGPLSHYVRPSSVHLQAIRCVASASPQLLMYQYSLTTSVAFPRVLLASSTELEGLV